MILKENWELRIRDSVYKDILKFPNKDKKRIVKIIENELVLNPYFGDIDKLKGEDNIWRRRVGNYRIFYEIMIEERIIYIFKVERRTSSTYGEL